MTLEEDIRQAVECLKKGGIILYPTDTVWGIGCDATNPDAVKKIYDLKRRAESKSMLVLVESDGALERIVDDIPEVAWELIDAAVNPLTVIYDHPKHVAPELLAPDGSLGIRITSEKYSNELCRRLRRPLVSTSANISGDKAARVYGEISEQIINGVDYVATYRRDDNSPAAPSNIIKVSGGGLIKIIR
ncbi:MAG: threonylcarbamoyl-AMP synthase [Muribaculaceae bacterium]|nr:threonylcarbamoyl-AMP synthase [Muribaculaceae bacterium]